MARRTQRTDLARGAPVLSLILMAKSFAGPPEAPFMVKAPRAPALRRGDGGCLRLCAAFANVPVRLTARVHDLDLLGLDAATHRQL